MTTSICTPWRALILGVCVAASLAATGCQVDIGGQVHPNPWYMRDDVQLYAPASEFKLPKEAAALQQYRADQQLQGR